MIFEILSSTLIYGYELSLAIAGRRGDILSLGKGTLYHLLYILETKKLIKGKWDMVDSGRKRRYYYIASTDKEELTKKTLAQRTYHGIESFVR